MTIFDYYIHKTVFSPVFMFNSLFLLIISLSSMRLYNLREYSIKSIEVIVLGMIFFSLGVFCTRIVSHEFLKNQNNVINYDDNLNVNWTFLKILLIVYFLMFLLDDQYFFLLQLHLYLLLLVLSFYSLNGQNTLHYK